MGSTFASLYFHVVFSTKERKPLIKPDWQQPLHEYLAGTLKRLHGYPRRFGGVEDHVHLLFSLKTDHKLAEIVRELKKASTAWFRATYAVNAFSWQEGYGAFTVSATALDAVENYIARQAEHHRTKTSREEFIELLERAGIEFDPLFVE